MDGEPFIHQAVPEFAQAIYDYRTMILRRIERFQGLPQNPLCSAIVPKLVKKQQMANHMVIGIERAPKRGGPGHTTLSLLFSHGPSRLAVSEK